jgi:SHS2 domain-containing protein
MGHAETFEHTADLGLRVFGNDLADLFEAAAVGLFDIIVVNRDQVRPIDTETITLTAETVADLFLAWLNELIFRSETGHRLFVRFRAQVDETGAEIQLHAEMAGEVIDRDRHILDHEVKAATHHGLIVGPVEGGWQAEVILDI